MNQKFNIMKIKLLFIQTFFLCMLISATFAQTKKTNNAATLPQEIKISWIFKELGRGEYEQPYTKVIAQINGKNIVILDTLSEQCSEIPKEGYKENLIPKTALAAFGSWWAGGGNRFYIAKQNNSNLVVMRMPLDESMESPAPFVKFKVITAKEIK